MDQETRLAQNVERVFLFRLNPYNIVQEIVFGLDEGDPVEKMYIGNWFDYEAMLRERNRSI
ncbi:hypothetical protein FBQ99_21050 [Chloroflexi bacterium CFX2]|nr:hypothetical protein [Chloroflexi bacterium CFX2]